MDANDYSRPDPQPVWTMIMVALMRHFAECPTAPTREWTGHYTVIDKKPQRIDFVQAVQEHANTCPDAAAIAHPHLATPFAKESPMTAQLPNNSKPKVLDLGEAYGKGLQLVDDDNNVFSIDRLVERLRDETAPVLPRIGASTIAKEYDICSPQQMDLDAGAAIGMRNASGGMAYVVLGGWAYLMTELMNKLLYASGESTALRVSDDDVLPEDWTENYEAPPWYAAPSQQERHVAGLSQQQLDAESGALLPDRTPLSATFGYGHGAQNNGTGYQMNITDTGLTELPPQAECNEVEPHVVLTEKGLNATTRRFPSHDDFWFTRSQKWVLQVLGTATWLVTFIAFFELMIGRRTNVLIVYTICFIISGLITTATAIVGGVLLDEYADEPQFARSADQAQRILWTCGAIVGWSILACADLMFLL